MVNRVLNCMRDFVRNRIHIIVSDLKYYVHKTTGIIMSLIAQSILPFFVISYCYYSVYKRLKRQATVQLRVLVTEAATRRRNEREKKRNKLLMTISLVYLITWLPLGIVGAFFDGKPTMNYTDPETPTILFMICR